MSKNERFRLIQMEDRERWNRKKKKEYGAEVVSLAVAGDVECKQREVVDEFSSCLLPVGVDVSSFGGGRSIPPMAVVQ